MTERLARVCAARPKRTLAAWGIGVLVALVLVATSLHGLTSNSNVVGSPESTKAAKAIARAFPGADAAKKHDVIVVGSERYRVGSPPFRAFLRRHAAQLRATGKVSDVRLAAISRDGRAALVSLTIDSDSGAKTVETLVERANGSGFSVGITGYRSANYDFGRQSQTDLESGELTFGLPAALVVLVLVFGAVVAGLVPVLMAILSIVVALGLVALISLEFSLSIFIVNMLTGMGLALGIDYSLFVVSRFREERTLGRSKEDAIARAGATASRAVLFSGSTFVVALVGMFIVPTSIMRSLALGAILVGVVSVAAALTLLPALLSLLGDRVNALRVPFIGRNLGRTAAIEGRFWRRVVQTVLRRPAVFLAVSVAAILAAASPIFGMHIGANGVATLPTSLPAKQGYVLLQREFPGQSPEPVNIVAVGGGAAATSDLARLGRRLAADSRFGRGTVRSSRTHDVSLLTVPVGGDSAGRSAVSAVRDLRARIIPSFFAGAGRTCTSEARRPRTSTTSTRSRTRRRTCSRSCSASASSC